ncbi:MAG: M20/M25/M40 family metallo-hydrolase [Betaproteobacteria bacterium]|nr:M20/M25/M40 family metallo-hydrolase [Betaproteobacteria bacterium]
MKLNDLQILIDRQWDESILPELVEYVKIPAKSPAFDPAWDAHGHLKSVVDMAYAWAKAQASKPGETPVLAGMALEIINIDGKTPCIFFDIPATGHFGSDRTTLFYGHLDKQPEMSGWKDHLGPWKPVIEHGRLYGRGSADDGYAIYATFSALASLDRQAIARPRCLGIIETCEESGSPDLPAYLEHLKPRLGDVSLVIGLDSGCGNYEQLWVTTSVEILEEGVHSGSASGIVPSSFRIARKLLNRLDDVDNGRVLAEVFHAVIPPSRIAQAEQAGAILGDMIWKQFPWVSCSHAPAGHEQACLSAQPMSTDPVEAILNRTWRPALSVTGAASLPSLDMAGNVLRPKTVLKLSMRIPPTVDAEKASDELKQILERDAPYQARVRFEADWAASGWHAPPMPARLGQLLDDLSMASFSKPAAYMGEGGTIPFMNMLGQHFPQAQFLITGVLGPHSNAHGPNEFLDIAYAKALTGLVAGLVCQAQD